MFTFKKHFASLSILVFLLPMLIQFGHAIEQHDHGKVCSSKVNKHLHDSKNTIDCKVCSFSLSNYVLAKTYFNLQTSSHLNTSYSIYYQFLVGNTKSSFYLRGPPSYSV